jgi:hypothetical protein
MEVERDSMGFLEKIDIFNVEFIYLQLLTFHLTF